MNLLKRLLDKAQWFVVNGFEIFFSNKANGESYISIRNGFKKYTYNFTREGSLLEVYFCDIRTGKCCAISPKTFGGTTNNRLYFEIEPETPIEDSATSEKAA